MGNGFNIEVPGDYFARTAAREYADDAGLAVVREFTQNACDAGCKTFSLVFRGNTIAAMDDGKGCDARTLREKVLRPLESQKGEDSVGGFGKAKELLFFANKSWEIRTRDCLVRGSYLTVESFVTGLEYFDGFSALVEFPEKLAQKASDNARAFFEASERPGVTWLLNNRKVDTRVSRAKRATKDFGFAKAYVERGVDDTYLYLRTNGLLTGKRYCWHGREVGRIVMELQGASTDLLTPARDNFKDFSNREQVDGWLNALVTDYRRELAEEEGDEILFFDDGTIESPPEEPVAVPAESVVKEIPRSSVVPAAAGGAIAAEVSFLSTCPELGDVKPPTSRKGFDFSLMPRIPGVGKVTVHTGSKARAKAGAKWLKANPHGAKQLLAAWATSVRECAKASGLPVDAVGFTFAESTLAEFVRSNGRFALLLNPLNFDFASYMQAEEILDLTTHELAHEATRGGHTEEWAMVEHAIRRKCRAIELKGAVARALLTGEVERSDDC